MKIENPRSRAYRIFSLILLILLAFLFLFPLYWIITGAFKPAADIYAKVSAVAGGNPMSDMGFVLEEFYNLSASDLEDFVFYMPDMSATTEEIFIARVKSGKLDAVKSACQSRQQGMKEDAAIYPSAAAYVESSQIVTNGDWILFVVVAEPDSAVTAFNGCF